mgnify:CR=1 FL=1
MVTVWQPVAKPCKDRQRETRGNREQCHPAFEEWVISFSVQLKEDNNKRLRSGLKTDVYVMNAVEGRCAAPLA